MMAEDPFKEEHGISIEELGFNPITVRSQQDFDALSDAHRRLFANIRYETSLPPEERRQIADRRRMRRQRAAKHEDPTVESPAFLVPDKKNIFVPVWDGFDQLCFSTMFDSLKMAGYNVVVGVVRPPKVVPPATDDRNTRPQVRSKSGVFVSGDFLFDYRSNSNFFDFDGIVIPSGDGVKGIMTHHKKVCSLIKVLAARKKLLCAAEDVPGILLLRLGTLSKTRCTGSERSEDEITNSVPPELGRDVQFLKQDSVVVDSSNGPTVITCRSAADSQECSLTICACLSGVEHMEEVAKKVGHESLAERVKKILQAAGKLEGGGEEKKEEKEEG